MTDRQSFWEDMAERSREMGPRTMSETLGPLVRNLDEGMELYDWIATVPEYLEGIREAGLEPAPCLIAKVMRARIFMATRLEAVADDGGNGRNQSGNSMEMTIRLVVPEGEVEKVAGRFAEGCAKWQGTTTPQEIGNLLAAAGRDVAGRRGFHAHYGEVIRDIYGGARMRETAMRVARRRNQLAGT